MEEVRPVVAHKRNPIPLSAMLVDFERVIPRVDKHKIVQNFKTLLDFLNVFPRQHLFVPQKTARTVNAPSADNQVKTVHLNVNRHYAKRRDNLVFGKRRSDDFAKLVEARFLVPNVARVVAARGDFKTVVFGKFPPSKRETFLVELLKQGAVALSCGNFRAKVKLGKLAPTHRSKRIPMEAHVFF